MKSKVMNGWIAGNSGTQNAAASGRDHVLEEYIHRENLALLKKRLTETCTDAQRKMLLKLLAQEEAKALPPKKAFSHRVIPQPAGLDRQVSWPGFEF